MFEELMLSEVEGWVPVCVVGLAACTTCFGFAQHERSGRAKGRIT